MTVYHILTVKPTRKPADFLRQLMLRLGGDSYTPADVFQKAKLDEKNVTIWYEYVIRCKTTGTIKYSMSVGYDRKEIYTDIEEKYDSKIGARIPVKVVKERTVTHWRPYSDTVSGEDTFKSFLPSKKSESLDSKWVDRFLQGTNSGEYILSDESAEIPASMIDRIYESLKFGLFHKVKNMGDHQKDEIIGLSSVKCQSLEVFKVPFIGITYQYDGRWYSAMELACGSDTFMQCSAPKIDTKRDPNKIARNHVKIERAIAKCCKWGTWLQIAGYFMLMGLMIPVSVLLPLVTVTPCALAAVVFSVIEKNKYERFFRDSATAARIAKLPYLEEALKNHNLAGLTESERAASFQYRETEKTSMKKLIKQGFVWHRTFVILVCIAMVILLGSFAIYGALYSYSGTLYA